MAFDSFLISFISSWPLWLHPFMYGLSVIGQPLVMIIIALVIGVIAVIRRNSRLGIAALIALATVLVNSLIKILIHRTRPDTYTPLHHLLQSYSFPSGHAAGSMIVCGLLAYIAWRKLPQRWSWIAVTLIIFVILAIGVSRVYLGAHYPTDVLGGWVVGVIGLLIIIKWVKPL